MSNYGLIYPTDDETSEIHVVVDEETIWSTQAMVAEMFGVNVPAISKHFSNIFADGELIQDSVVSIMETTAADGKTYNTLHYSLDAIIAVGYRVNSVKATRFRIWATEVLRQYIRDGYVIDEKRLREDPAALNKLAAKLRELRASEKNIYASVRECFKLAASDYAPSSDEVRSFFALLQDKFHHAVTEKTSSKLIMDRADHAASAMGVVTMKELVPTLAEALVGKNYLREDELYRLHLLSEQFLLYAESTALAGKEMTMASLHEQLDTLLRLNGYPVFGGYKDYLRNDAKSHAAREHKMHIEILQLGILLDQPIDLETYYAGEYAEFKEDAAKISINQMNKLINKGDAAKLLPSNAT